MVLQRESSPLRDRLDASLEENQTRHEEIKAVFAENINLKKASQSEKGLPPEKSAV